MEPNHPVCFPETFSSSVCRGLLAPSSGPAYLMFGEKLVAYRHCETVGVSPPFPGLTQALEVPLLGVEKQPPLPLVIPEPRAVVAISRASRTCPVTDDSHRAPSDPRLQALAP